MKIDKQKFIEEFGGYAIDVSKMLLAGVVIKIIYSQIADGTDTNEKLFGIVAALLILLGVGLVFKSRKKGV